MRRNELDYLLTTLLDFNKDVSDIIFTVDRPPQVEAAGQLLPVPVSPPIDRSSSSRASLAPDAILPVAR